MPQRRPKMKRASAPEGCFRVNSECGVIGSGFQSLRFVAYGRRLCRALMSAEQARSIRGLSSQLNGILHLQRNHRERRRAQLYVRIAPYFGSQHTVTSGPVTLLNGPLSVSSQLGTYALTPTPQPASSPPAATETPALATRSGSPYNSPPRRKTPSDPAPDTAPAS